MEPVGLKQAFDVLQRDPLLRRYPEELHTSFEKFRLGLRDTLVRLERSAQNRRVYSEAVGVEVSSVASGIFGHLNRSEHIYHKDFEAAGLAGTSNAQILMPQVLLAKLALDFEELVAP